MTRLLVATRNRGKQAEFRDLLMQAPFEIVFPDDVGLRESSEEAGLEVHATFEDNARAKARWFAARSGIAALADDSGLEVDALAGAPGVQSKRFAGLSGSDDLVTDANNGLLLARLLNVDDARRTARYRCVLVVAPAAGDDTAELCISGRCEGRILRGARGSNGFGYDPLFFSDEIGKTFGEAAASEKRAVSHRGRAVAALADRLRARRV